MNRSTLQNYEFEQSVNCCRLFCQSIDLVKMSFPTAHTYHADSDADDEYERSILTSPMPPTDDETSSIGDSEHGSHEHTPTTFEAAEYGRASPRTVITEWSTDECAGFLNGIGLGQYGRAFRGRDQILGLTRRLSY